MIELGEALFNDKDLSSDRTIACANCHKIDLAFTDGLTVSRGVYGRIGTRNSPTVFNVRFNQNFLWDGRAQSLQEQIQLALTNPAEMDMNEDLIDVNLKPEIAKDLERETGLDPSLDTVGMAIASYVDTLETSNSRADRYLFCDEDEALNAEEEKGLKLFSGPANCVRCHTMSHESVHPFGGAFALFTDGRFHNVGVGSENDRGRWEVTGRSEDIGAFKTPSLRRVSLTAPYMHDGSIRTLPQVLEFYNQGGKPKANLDSNIRPLGLTEEELEALLAFLMSL